jgi:hypothetical protein
LLRSVSSVSCFVETIRAFAAARRKREAKSDDEKDDAVGLTGANIYLAQTRLRQDCARSCPMRIFVIAIWIMTALPQRTTWVREKVAAKTESLSTLASG